MTQVSDPGGRSALLLETADSEVLVSLLGAQILSWRQNGRDVLWTATNAEYAAGKPVRGGIPVVWPWFGDHPTDRARPAHGFVRNLQWQLAETQAGPKVILELTDSETTRALWPHAFWLRLEIALADTLRIALTVENRGEEPFEFEEALHTYFAVGSVHEAAVKGLEGVDYVEHAAAPEPDWNADEPLRFRAETDRVFQGVPPRLQIDAPTLARTVTLVTERSHSAIVWNPWPAKTARLSQMAPDDWQQFVCVESGNVHAGALRLGPGESHTMTLTLSCSDGAR